MNLVLKHEINGKHFFFIRISSSFIEDGPTHLALYSSVFTVWVGQIRVDTSFWDIFSFTHTYTSESETQTEQKFKDDRECQCEEKIDYKNKTLWYIDKLNEQLN